MSAAPFTVVYRFKVLPGREDDFERYWTFGTELFRSERGSLGSSLMRDAQGDFVAIALWPSREAWANKAPLSAMLASILTKMRDCTSQITTEAELKLLVDRWV